MTGGGRKLVEIHVFGAFGVTGPGSVDLTPRSEKGQALLALLVTARHNRCTRTWLQDKLWSQSDPARGASSLRQVLATLRRALGPCADVLQADRRMVWLAKDRFTSDWHDQATDPSVFLEGIDIDDPEFGAWLSNIRNRPAAAETAGAVPAAPHDARRRWRITLAGAGKCSGFGDVFEADLLCFLSNGLRETGVVDIGATANDPLDPLAIDVSVALTPLDDDHFGVRISVLRPQRRRILWSAAKVVRIGLDGIDANPTLAVLIAAAQAAIMREISCETNPAPGLGREALRLSRSARRVFSFDTDTLVRTDRHLADLEEGRARGVALGLRAQISVIRDIERLTAAPEETVERGLGQAARALEADPGNSFVLSAAANAQVFLKWDVETGADLAAAALRANSSNPLAWWAQANVALYNQSPERALDSAQTATSLAAGTPLHFWCLFQLGLAALATNRLEFARRSLETSAAMAPSFRPPRRYLLALYAHLGQTDRANRTARDLASLEKDFSLDAFARDTRYPVSLARRLGLIDPRVIADLDCR